MYLKKMVINKMRGKYSQTEQTLKTVRRDKEGHYIMNKGSSYQDLVTVSICSSSIGTPKYIKNKMNKAEQRNKQYHDYRDFNILFSIM